MLILYKETLANLMILFQRYRDHLRLLLKWVVFVTDVQMSSSQVCHEAALPYQVYILQVYCQPVFKTCGL